MVSLPFSDYCAPLYDSFEEFEFVLKYVCAELQHRNWKYVELRAVCSSDEPKYKSSNFGLSKSFYLHVLDLGRDLDQIFRNCSKDSVQRRIRRAERANLVYERGVTTAHLSAFYRLLISTRARHSLPPQPYAWFKNLVDCMGDSLELRLAYYERQPIAAVMTLRFCGIVYYKYSCSDTRFKNLGATPFLLWKAIEESKATGARQFDLGRSEVGNDGLISFKDHWSAKRSALAYWRFPASDVSATREARNLRLAKRMFSCIPRTLLAQTGRLIYRHIG